MNPYLFAYGFLKRMYHGSQETKTPPMEVTFFSTGLYQGQIYRIDHYPGVVYDPGAPFRVKGEIFKMVNPEALLPTLDTYERSLPLITENPEYQRVLRPIQTEQGIMECWVYEYLLLSDKHPVIASGEF